MFCIPAEHNAKPAACTDIRTALHINDYHSDWTGYMLTSTIGAPLKIESEDIDLENLLSGGYFKIPRFQRPYSWDDENIQDLWNDVTSASGEDYFIGSMVVYKTGKQEFNLVDGQQRLTTITVLLCAIRDAFAALKEENLAQGVHQLIERKNRDNQSEYVLQTETSFPFLQEKILKFGEPELLDLVEMAEEDALKDAHQLLKRKVQSISDAVDIDGTIPEGQRHEVKVSRLKRLRDSVFNLKVIFVKLENEDDAYLIFETLNTRGKDLAVTDLVKNHFAKLLRKRNSVDAVKLKWSTVLETIHESSADINSDAFIYHFWASRHEAVPVKKLYPVLKKKVDAKNAKTYLDDLVQDSKYYRAIHEPAFMWEKHERTLARSLEAIQLFRLVQPTPALLSLVRAYKDKKIKLGKLTEAVGAIEDFHFAFTAVTSSRSSGGISGMYSAFARRLFEASDSNSAALEIRNLVAKLRERRPSFDEFEVGFRQIGFTNANTKQKGLVRYILQKFAANDGFKFAVDTEELTIEHVEPQASIGLGDWTEESVGALGNLFLLDQKMNGKLDNKPFIEKKQMLSEGNYSVPSFVQTRATWTPVDVRTHTDDMAKSAYDSIWSIG